MSHPGIPLYRIRGGTERSELGTAYPKGERYVNSMDQVEHEVYQKGQFRITVEEWRNGQWESLDPGQIENDRFRRKYGISKYPI